MLNKLKKTILFLVIASLMISMQIFTASAAETREITVPTEQTSFTVELTVNESSLYAGIEFGLTLSDESAVQFVSFEQGTSVQGASTSPFVTVNGTHYFGFWKASNVFSGNIKIGTLHFTYTGNATQTITITHMKVARIGADNKSVGYEKASPVMVLTVSRDSTVGGSTGGGLGNGNISGSIEVVINDSDTPLTGIKTRSDYFDDVDETWAWAVTEIDHLYEAGVVNGTAPRTYSPASNITRGDFMLMLVRAYKLTADFEDNFSDVPAESYYYDAIGIAKKLGVAQGVGENKFAPTSPITRQDMMVLVSRTLETIEKPLPAATQSSLLSFADYAKISGYAKDSVAALVQSGIIKGDGTNINPLGNTTRAEMAVVIYRMLNMQ